MVNLVRTFKMNRNPKARQIRVPGQQGAELENQFIMKIPQKQAEVLREALRQGQTNIKDRLFVQLDYTGDKDDMRNGTITFDTLMYKARLMDLPTIIETWKTTDGKNFYKTADVCQMLMVREEEDPPEDPVEDSKKKRRDPNKVDKKYLFPHGITPPLKNIRKRRFRKTLKKKNLDLPEIEKEVKRLLRTDNEAATIRWEVVREEDEKKSSHSMDGGITSSNLDEELFGEALSSSDDEVGATINILDEDDDSRLSVDDSRFSESYQTDMMHSPAGNSKSSTPLVTEFSSSMFKSDQDYTMKPEASTPTRPVNKGTKVKRPLSAKKSPAGGRMRGSEESFMSSPISHLSQQAPTRLYAHLSNLESDLTTLLSQRAAQESEIATIENLALKQRFLSKLADIDSQIREKEMEISEVRAQLTD